MSHRLKLMLFVLAFTSLGLLKGYFLQGLGLLWLLPILFVTAVLAVLVSRWWLT